MKIELPTALFVTIVAMIILVSMIEESQEHSSQQSMYCEMVATYHETKGNYGWPDYQDNYNEVCNGKLED